MQRSIVAGIACAITFVIGFASPLSKAQNVTAPTVRIGGDAKGLQPIRVRQVDTTTDVVGRLSRKTLTFELSNPNNRVLEGTMEFPLAAGQQITGFALDIAGDMREAVPVPKDKGRQVFESIERRGVDPGLLEQTAGNNFRVRVYPIPANGVRRVRLTIDDTLARGAAKKASYAARRDNGEVYVLGEVPVEAASKPRVIPDRVGILWDASASTRTHQRAHLQMLGDYLRAMGNGTVTLRLLRDVGEDAGTYEIRNGDWSALHSKLETVVYDGATDLADWTPRADIAEYLLFSDGHRNYGERDVPRLSATQRLYAIAPREGGSDTARLATLAQQRNGRLVLDRWHDRGDVALRQLTGQSLRIVGLAPHGVTDLEVPGRFIDDGVLRVAGRATQRGAYVDVTLDDGAGQRIVRVDMPINGPSHPQVASLWAGWKVRALSVDPERNAAQIARIGQQFGIVTPGTSLIVLENADDYVRYDIPAPAALREEVAQLQAVRDKERKQNRNERIDSVADKFAQRIAWWERKFPKDSPRTQKIAKENDVARRAYASAAEAAEAAAMAADAAADAADAAASMAREEPSVVFDAASPQELRAPAPAMAAPASAELMSANFVSAGGRDAPGPTATITLQPWQSDAPYARRLRDAKPADVYALYLGERDAHADSTAFYLDVAGILLAKGRRSEALRVLSNLAEMQLESRHVLRVLGYRLMQANDDARAVEVFRKVLAMADEEPQSHRDLGLALAATGHRQEAIEHLYEVVARPWDGRFDEVELVALNELNAIVATSPQPLDTAFVDRRLLRNLPVDLRAVLSWDSDNSDMDLWVTDPNGERCYYGNRLTYQGGQLSDDFTGGYGPEEFLLRDAKPGKYRVEANFYGDRQQIVTGATTLTLTLTTGWGTAARKDQAVTLRLTDARETVLVGEFEVK
ncbi:VIT domain-containing protein [Noviluteimonas gilva]|uniref:DUF2135 domain-containing protein n=1 Tax=Noviluteimonas gilva TaxID=2682097 RepID=A0A7C9HNA7_9GAMM|nr:VIT domain-containing protein [Lysobacter gilvus]MUV14896.1 DUF2135 domain-containing protein [Lysobacter gilvus]